MYPYVSQFADAFCFEKAYLFFQHFWSIDSIKDFKLAWLCRDCWQTEMKMNVLSYKSVWVRGYQHSIIYG